MVDLSILDQIGTFKTADLLTRASELNLDARTTQLVVAKAILENLGRLHNTFGYREPLAPDSAALASTVSRTFAHDDWFDGQSPVQAGETASEEGFNKRFHAIEADLDALIAEVKRAFAEMAALRHQLASMFEDIRAEINRLDGQLVDTTVNPRPDFTVPPVFTQPIDPRVFPGFDPTVPIGPIKDPFRPGVIWQPNDMSSRIIEFAGQPGKGSAFGKPATRLSREVFSGQQVDVWSTDAGMIMVPVQSAQVVTGDATHGLMRAANAAGWMASNAETVRTAVGEAPFTIEDARTKLGDVVLDDGTKFSDALAQVPDGTQFVTPDDLAAAITDSESAAIVRNGQTLDAIVAAVGFSSGDASVQDVQIDSFRSLDEGQRNALSAAGINTVGALAQADTAAVNNAFTAAGLAPDPAGAARVVALGKGLVKLRQR